MAHHHSMAARIKPTQPLPQECKIKLETSPLPLMQSGFNIPVTITPASMVRKITPEKAMKSITVMAHFDTGASKTNIDMKIADYLGLSSVGISKNYTAAGPTETPMYAVDILFPGTQLKQFTNLQVGSCKLPFDMDMGQADFLSKTNFGVLIGRDIMSNWNIVWNGPTSTVLISD